MNGILVVNGTEYELKDLKAFNIAYGVSPDIDIVINLELEDPNVGTTEAQEIEPQPGEKLEVIAEGVGRPSSKGIQEEFEGGAIFISDVMEPQRLAELLQFKGPAYLPLSMDTTVEAQRIRKEATRLGYKELRTKYYSVRAFGTVEPLEAAVAELLNAEKIMVAELKGQYGRRGNSFVVFNKDKSKFRLRESDFEVWGLPAREESSSEKPQVS